MSMTHTPGRILFRENGEANQHAMLSDDGRWWLALLANGEMSTERQRANFRRLAACWNSSEGVSTEALETGPTRMESYQREERRADKAERERDELRAALDAVLAIKDFSDLIDAAREHCASQIETIKAEPHFYTPEDLQCAEDRRVIMEAQAEALEAYALAVKQEG